MGNAVGIVIASISALRATPCAADRGLFAALVVRLSMMSATLTLLVVISSISDRLDLMYATTSESWSSVVSSLSARALSRSVRPWINSRMSLWVSAPVLCADTWDEAVPDGSAPTSDAV